MINSVMELKVVPIKKQSKKAQKEFYARRRRNWHGVQPATKVIKSKKIYDRNKLKNEPAE